MNPSGSSEGVGSSVGKVNVNFCSRADVNKKSSMRAKLSPIQERFPKIKVIISQNCSKIIRSFVPIEKGRKVSGVFSWPSESRKCSG